MKRIINIATTILGILAISSSIAVAAALEGITVMALGPLDGRAVVKTADGKMQVLKLGDTIPGTRAVMTQVLTDKLVVEETVEKQGQPPVKQTVWISKPAKPGDKSVVQRLDREGPPKEPVTMPVVTPGVGKKN